MKRVLMIFQTPKKPELYVTTLPPLGLLSIASYLESKGITADVVDCHVQKLDTDFSNYDVVFFGANISNSENTIDTVREVKAQNPDTGVVVGGPIGPKSAGHYLRVPEVDAVILGEGECTAHEYLTAENKSKVRGMVLRDSKGGVVFTGNRSPMLTLDKLPFPALDKVSLEKYNVPIKKASPISSIVTSRGCPYGCIFCSHSPVWRQRSPKHVVAEIEWQVNELGVKEVAVNDENLILNRKRVLEICAGIRRRGIEVRLNLYSGVRPDLLDRELLKALRDAGTWILALAPETGNPETLSRIRKGFTLEQVRQAVRWCKELGIHTSSFYTLGFPWEKREHLEDTLRFMRELDTDFAYIFRAYPLEGTPLYDKMGVRPSEDFKEGGWSHGTMKHDALLMSNEEVHDYIKRGYKEHYNLKKMKRIFSILSPNDILSLVRYSIVSRSR